MDSRYRRPGLVALAGLAIVFSAWSGAALAQGAASRAMDPANAAVIAHWTAERRRNAIPRDLVIDGRGLAYLRLPGGALRPYGHQLAALDAGTRAAPNAGPPGNGGDQVAPTISDMSPATGATVGVSQLFSARVTDDSGIKSVSFFIRYPDGSTSQRFSPNPGADGGWSLTISGFSNGSWSWWVEAKDGAGKGGNLAVSPEQSFTVDTGADPSDPGDPGDSGDTVANAEWLTGGAVQTAAGRIYFEMPANAKWKGPWNGYVCSGTAVGDSAGNRSIILTAAHCVYDDANSAFARNVLFIPNQAGTTASGTDLNCNNDPLGCWTPSFGVVDTDWTAAVFPDNIPWDYAYYVVPVSGGHSGAGAGGSLEAAAGTMTIDFSTAPMHTDGTDGADSSDFSHALGYSWSDDPDFMYCADDMTTEGSDNWWLPNCDLSGGSSGGPWVQKMDAATGNGPVISVNSWGYTTAPGMAGPKLFGSSAECVFDSAEQTPFESVSTADGYAGVAADCP